MGQPLFHVLNRGVDKRDIFLDDEDRFRFIHDLFEFNDKMPVPNLFHVFHKKSQQNNDVGGHYIGQERRTRELLVHIHAFCLMSNHYHLILSPVIEGGIVQFIRKLDGGYAKYFNEKYERSGTLFQSRYKRIQVATEAHFVHLPYYIHLNPLDVIAPEWRTREVTDYSRAIDFLENYRWSSHLDYLGKQNFPSVTQREFLLTYFGSVNGYKTSIYQWLRRLTLDKLHGVTLE